MANDTREHIRYEQPSTGVARNVRASAQTANVREIQPVIMRFTPLV